MAEARSGRFEFSKKALLARSISAITLAASAPVIAAEGEIEEMFVTVQRRSESVQDVPLAVSAFSGEFMREVNLDDVKDLVAYTPGLTGNSRDSFIDLLQMRGIFTLDFGVGGDPSISFFKNGLYQGRNGAVVTSLYDIDRTEVVRGSQGFLFGRNSIAGAISTYTRRPEFDGRDGYVQLDAGERSHLVAEGAVNVPLGTDLAARIAVYHSQEDGYVDDAFDPSRDDLIEHNKDAVRLSLRGRGANTDVNFMAEYENRKQSGSIYRAIPAGETWETLESLFGVSLRGDKQDADSDLSSGEADDAKILSLGLQIDHDLGWAMLTSLTGYKDHEYYYAEDFDGSPLGINNYLQDQEGTYFEQELRLVSQNDGPLSWYGGVSYYHEQINTLFTQVADENVMCTYYLSYYGFSDCSDYFAYYGYVFTPNPDGLVESNRVKGNYHGYAAYVDLTYAFSEALDASVGLRYTKDEKKFKNQAFDVDSELGPFWAIGFTTDGYLQDKHSWDDLTPRVLVRYFANEDWMLFGSVTWGYKSGGYGSFALNPDPVFGTTGVTQAEAVPDTFDPENSISYEVGTKGSFADGRAQLNANFYYYTYEDLQVIIPQTSGGIRVGNAGNVDGWGLEGTLRVVLGANWDLFFSGAWADTKATDVEVLCDGSDECDGNGLAGLPKFSYGAVLQGAFPQGSGEWIGRLEGFGQTKTFGGQTLNPLFKNPGWTEMAVRGGYRSNSGWEVIGYVENVTDEKYFDATSEDGGILPAHAIGPSRPRTFGVKLGWTFD